jgi:arylformamidase
MARFDPDWLDREYNNRARIPEHPQIFERWQTASAHARSHASRRLDVRYGDGPNELLDVFPTATAAAPVLLFIHGGYWRALDKSDTSFIAPALVQAGVLVVVPNYALCPAVTIEQITMQMVRAVAWTYRHAALYGGDPERIVVAGHSAGGHLAAMLALCEWRSYAKDLPADVVKGILGISGLYDLEPVAQVPFLRDDLRLGLASARKLSPSNLPAPRGCRVMTAVGANESSEFLRQNRLLREHWGTRVVPVCEEIPGTNHLDVLHDLADPQGRLHALARQLCGV